MCSHFSPNNSQRIWACLFLHYSAAPSWVSFGVDQGVLNGSVENALKMAVRVVQISARLSMFQRGLLGTSVTRPASRWMCGYHHKIWKNSHNSPLRNDLFTLLTPLRHLVWSMNRRCRVRTPGPTKVTENSSGDEKEVVRMVGVRTTGAWFRSKVHRPAGNSSVGTVGFGSQQT